MEERSRKILLIVDSNILFSYFILSEEIRKLILNPEIILYTPDWTVHELNKYFDQKIAKIAEKKGVSRKNLSWWSWT